MNGWRKACRVLVVLVAVGLAVLVVIVEEHIPCHKRGVYGKERDNAG